MSIQSGVDLVRPAHQLEGSPLYESSAAVREAFFAIAGEARRRAMAGLELSKSRAWRHIGSGRRAECVGVASARGRFGTALSGGHICQIRVSAHASGTTRAAAWRAA